MMLYRASDWFVWYNSWYKNAIPECIVCSAVYTISAVVVNPCAINHSTVTCHRFIYLNTCHVHVMQISAVEGGNTFNK